MLQHLLQAYRGELYGIAFFQTLLNTATSTHERRAWQLLIDIEQRTAECLSAYLIPRGIPCPEDDDDMVRAGQQQANLWIDLPWDTLMATLAPWIRTYAERYRQQVTADNPHHTISSLVADHEDAILAFVEREMAQAANSLAPLTEFLARYPSPRALANTA
ncbi:hypothetical protein GCM10023116_17210 [Kistimonas scapharcae]|uniref:Uncharacterized protein n=1 Tax=Kistimonas scapharcae TaxID=1036133 RepID=A0ABP8V0U5_9GAMM